MTQQIINVGPAPNDGLGDPIRTAFIKSNDNFSQLYSRAQSTPPTSLVGIAGDQAGMYAYDSTYFYYCFQDYDGSSVIWAQVTQVGNISVSSIQNGNTSIVLNPSGNAQVSIGGSPNIVVWSTTGEYVSGLVSATGNITGGNIVTLGNVAAGYFIGNGSQLTGLPASYSDSNVTSLLANFGSNTISMTGNIATANVQAGNVLTQGQVSATGNVVTASYFVGNFVGNVTGNFVVPGNNTQVLFNTNGNADAVAGFTYKTDSNTMTVLGVVSAQGNVIGGNISTANIVSAAGNIVTTANVSAGNVLVTTRVQATTLSATGNVNGGNVTVSGSGIISAGGNITGANVNTGILSASANIVGANISISGNITGGNVLFGANIVSGTGNVNGGNINSSALVSAATVSASSNITGGNVLFGTGIVSGTGNVYGGNASIGTLFNATSITGTTISVSGNITGDYFFGNGSQLQGINVNTNKIVNGTSEANIGAVSGNANITINGTSNITVFANTGVYVTGLISANGNITGGNLNASGLSLSSNVIGNLNVTSNIAGGNLLFGSGQVVGTGNITGGNVLFGSGVVSGTGNITGGNVLFGSGVVSGTGNITGGNLSVNTGNITLGNIVNSGSNATGNIGSATTYFNRLFAQATTALYADLAEMYLADKQISSGTVVSFGGNHEITTCAQDMDPRVAGVVSHKPAYQMNSGLEGDFVIPVALQGRVPCHVVGAVRKGDMMVSAGNGQARAEYNPPMGTVIGKSLEDFDGGVGTIEIVVGRL